ncbi:MAG: hypothetical protein AB7F64_05370 [Gammaproteobacteria bacterium]
MTIINLLHFIQNNIDLLYVKVSEQLYLVLTSTVIALIIGIPLGIWLSKKIKL